MRTRRFALVTSVLLVLGVAFQNVASAQESAYDAVKKRGTLIVGAKRDYPPLGFMDKSGAWVGVEIDFARYVADKLGVELKIEEVTSRTRIPMLVNGNIDVIMSLSGTRERSKVVDFTQPYFNDGTTLLVYKDGGIKSVDDAAAPRKVSTAQGSSSATELLGLQPKAQIIYFQDYPAAFAAFKAKKVDAMVAGVNALNQLARGDGNMEVLLPPITPDPSSIAIRLNDSKWRLFFEQCIMEAWMDGTIQKLHAKYVGTPISFRVEVWPDFYRK